MVMTEAFVDPVLQPRESESVTCSVMSDSLQPHRQEPTRLLCPWNSPGKNTEKGMPFSRESSQHRDRTPGFLHCRQVLTTKPPTAPITTHFLPSLASASSFPQVVVIKQNFILISISESASWGTQLTTISKGFSGLVFIPSHFQLHVDKNHICFYQLRIFSIKLRS